MRFFEYGNKTTKKIEMKPNKKRDPDVNEKSLQFDGFHNMFIQITDSHTHMHRSNKNNDVFIQTALLS
jgi:hypothetical protein